MLLWRLFTSMPSVRTDFLRIFSSAIQMLQAYGRWHHIECWRIPASIWLALPDADKCHDAKRFEAALVEMQQLAFCGFTDLSPEHKQEFVAHCMNKAHYAKANKNSKAYNDGVDSPEPSRASTGSADTLVDAGSMPDARGAVPMSASPSALALYVPPAAAQLELAARGDRFVLPRPGVNGAQHGALNNKTFVLTGIFPEVGGGVGLNLGKDRVKAMIESFGGRVTSAISGVTNVVLVGAEPGAVSVKKARERGIQMPDIQGLKLALETAGASLAIAPPARITSYSKGYGGKLSGLIEQDQPVAQLLLGSEGSGAASGGFKAKKKRAAPKAPKAAASKAPKQPKKAPLKKAAAAAATDDVAPPSKKRRTNAK